MSLSVPVPYRHYIILSIDSQYPMCYYHYMGSKQEWLQVRMSAKEKIKLQDMADRYGLSMSDLVREAIDIYRRFHLIKSGKAKE